MWLFFSLLVDLSCDLLIVVGLFDVVDDLVLVYFLAGCCSLA